MRYSCDLLKLTGLSALLCLAACTPKPSAPASLSQDTTISEQSSSDDTTMLEIAPSKSELRALEIARIQGEIDQVYEEIANYAKERQALKQAISKNVEEIHQVIANIETLQEHSMKLQEVISPGKMMAGNLTAENTIDNEQSDAESKEIEFARIQEQIGLVNHEIAMYYQEKRHINPRFNQAIEEINKMIVEIEMLQNPATRPLREPFLVIVKAEDLDRDSLLTAAEKISATFAELSEGIENPLEFAMFQQQLAQELAAYYQQKEQIKLSNQKTIEETSKLIKRIENLRDQLANFQEEQAMETILQDDLEH